MKTTPVGSQWASDYMTQTTYDALDRVSASSSYAVDANGNVDPAQTRTINRCYDLAGDLRSITGPKGATGFSCPAVVLPANYIYTSAAYTTKFTYDAAHRQLTQTAPDASQTQASYDENGHVISATDQNTKVTQLFYDDRGLKIKEIDPFDSGTSRSLTQEWEYDALGNVKRFISPRAYDAGGANGPYIDYVTSYSYDALNRLVKTTVPTNASTPASYLYVGYDANGDRTMVSLPSAQPSAASLAPSEKTLTDYLDSGAVYSQQDPANPKVHFDYSAEGWQASRIPELTGPAGALDFSHAMFWDYTPDGLLKALRDIGGERARYSYDADGNQTSITEAKAARPESDSRLDPRLTPSFCDPGRNLSRLIP